MSDGSEGSNFDPTLAIHGYGMYLDCIVIVCTVNMTYGEHGTFVAVYSIVSHLDEVKTDEVSDTPEVVGALVASVSCGDHTDGEELAGCPNYVSDSVIHTYDCKFGSKAPGVRHFEGYHLVVLSDEDTGNSKTKADVGAMYSTL